MKNLILGLVCALLATDANAQGFVTFNNIGNPMTSVTTGEPLGPGFTVDLVVGGQVLASTPVVGGGTFLGANLVDLGTADPVEVSIAVYPARFPDIETAAATPGTEIYCETFVTQGGNPHASPPEVPAPLGFPGLSFRLDGGISIVNCIPEPSAFGLCVMGICLLTVGRRPR